MCVCVCDERGGERGERRRRERGGREKGRERTSIRKGIQRRQMVRDILHKEEGIGIEEET